MKYLIVGLGNIGNEYAGTRHNIGFDVLHAFITKHKGTFNTERLAYQTTVKFKGKQVVCICPTTYMNLSGKAVKYWMDKEKIPIENILIVVDDIALTINELRMRPSGSDAGHNGLKSIQENLLTINYPRLRFGIGNNFAKGMQVEFVLGKWQENEIPIVKIKIEEAVKAIENFIHIGIERTMNEINKRININA